MDIWTINSRTYAMSVGGGAVHSYIAIKDNAGRVVAEYHGFPFDRETGDREGDNPLAFTPLSNFQLRPDRFRGEFWPARQNPRVHEEEVFRGSPSQVQQIQLALDRAMDVIDQKDIDYGGVHFLSESRNSNSMYGTLMQVADQEAQAIGAGRIEIPDRLLRDKVVFDSDGRSSWAPGIHRNLLLEPDPALTNKRSARPDKNKS